MAQSRRQRAKKEGTFLETVKDSLRDITTQISQLKEMVSDLQGAKACAPFYPEFMPGPDWNDWNAWEAIAPTEFDYSGQRQIASDTADPNLSPGDFSKINREQLLCYRSCNLHELPDVVNRIEARPAGNPVSSEEFVPPSAAVLDRDDLMAYRFSSCAAVPDELQHLRVNEQEDYLEECRHSDMWKWHAQSLSVADVASLAERSSSPLEPGPLWRLLDERTRATSDAMEGIGSVSIVELHQDITLGAARKMSVFPTSFDITLLAKMAAKVMIQAWRRGGFARLPQTPETSDFVRENLVEAVVGAASEYIKQLSE